jgi:hypothetical protein
MWYSSSGSKNKPKGANSVCYILHAGFLFGFSLNPEYEDSMFLRNVDCISTEYMSFYPAASPITANPVFRKYRVRQANFLFLYEYTHIKKEVSLPHPI